MKNQSKYVFTFGSGQQYAGFYQPIYATNPNLARGEMVKLHGIKWSHQYNEEQWKEYQSGGYPIEHPLEAVYCEEDKEEDD